MNPTSQGAHETRLIGAPANWDPAKDGECVALSVVDATDDRGHNVMISRWELQDDELDRLRNGAPVHLQVLGQVHPVVSLFVGHPARTGPAAEEPENPLARPLAAAVSALRSYQYGNAATELAEEIADAGVAALSNEGITVPGLFTPHPLMEKES